MDDCPGLQMALKVASWGWRVAPGFCNKHGQKIPLMGDWVKNATTDPDKLRSVWANRSWLWPGVVSGVDSCLVLDCDGPASVDWLRSLVASEGWTGGGLVYRTPGRGGGLHCVWSWPDFLKRDFSQAKVALEGGEVQIRGNGHWTLLAGAKRPDGVYEVLEVPDDVHGPLAAPQGLIQAILRQSVVHTSSMVPGDLVSLSPEDAWAKAPFTDGRKNAVAGLVYHLAMRNVDESEALDTCLRFGAECCIPPLSDDIVKAKVKYMYETKLPKIHQQQAELMADAKKLIDSWSKYA